MSSFRSVRQHLGVHVSLLTALSVFAAPAVAQQAGAPNILDAVGGNSANNQVFYLDFANGATVQLNTDATGRASLRSFEFFKNSCDKRLDLVAADTNRGELVLFENSRGAEIVAPCEAGVCPSSPDGLSSSNERLMSVADTGQGGSTPAVWFYQPEDCDTAGDWPFQAPVSGGQFSVGTTGPGTFVTSIADTEFVKVLGGGLNAGDLLVITSNPETIARVPRENIAALLDGNASALGAAQILADSRVFGGETPTGMAFVPGTAGIGANDSLSESEDLLVALNGGTVLKLTFKQDSALSQTVVEEVFLEGLGNGALGIAAGTRDDDTYMLIADRNKGKFLRYVLDVANDGTMTLNDTPPAEILGVQNPQGVVFNSDAYDASRCVSGEGGCRIRRTVELEFTQEIQALENFSTIFANIFVVPDPRSGGRGTLKLSDVSSEFDEKLEIPPSCVGFSLPDDPAASVLVVLNINNDVDVLSGEYVQTRELVNQIIPQLGDCTETGARLFYHPDPDALGNFGPSEPEQGTLYDTTYSCENPSRSISREYSPIVICADAFFGATTRKGKGAPSKKVVQAEATQRADYLQQVIFEGLPDGELRTILSDHVDAAKAFIKRGDYLSASASFDAGAFSVAWAKDTFTGDDTLRASLYGDLLGRFLALAFFTSESLSGGAVQYVLGSDICDLEPKLEGCSAN